MKHPIFGLCILIALFPGVGALAQSAPVQLAGVTNTLPASSTNNILQVISVESSEDVALQFSFALGAPGTGNVTFSVDRGIDRTNWLSLFSLPIAGTGTNLTSAGTNVNVQAFPFLRINQGINANTSAVSRLSVFVNTKKGL